MVKAHGVGKIKDLCDASGGRLQFVPDGGPGIIKVIGEGQPDIQAVINRLHEIIVQHGGSLNGKQLGNTLYKEMDDAQAVVKAHGGGKIKDLCDASGGRLRYISKGTGVIEAI